MEVKFNEILVVDTTTEGQIGVFLKEIGKKKEILLESFETIEEVKLYIEQEFIGVRILNNMLLTPAYRESMSALRNFLANALEEQRFLLQLTNKSKPVDNIELLHVLLDVNKTQMGETYVFDHVFLLQMDQEVKMATIHTYSVPKLEKWSTDGEFDVTIPAHADSSYADESDSQLILQDDGENPFIERFFQDMDTMQNYARKESRTLIDFLEKAHYISYFKHDSNIQNTILEECNRVYDKS